MKMNLQYFAEENDDSKVETDDAKKQGENDNKPSNDDIKSKNKDDKKSSSKTYTEDELKDIIKKHQEDWKKQQDDAEKLKKMSDEQKAKYQLDKIKQEAEKNSQELAKYKMRDTAREMATDAGIELTHGDIEHIVTSNADTTKANIDWLAQYTNRLKKSLKSELLKGNPPKTGGKKLNNDKESYGAKLAKKNSQQIKNPYFK